MSDYTFLEHELPDRPDPTYWAVRILTGPYAGRCAWVSGDIPQGVRLGQIHVLREPLLVGVDAAVWRFQQADAAARERARRLGLEVPQTAEDVDDWSADRGLLGRITG